MGDLCATGGVDSSSGNWDERLLLDEARLGGACRRCHWLLAKGTTWLLVEDWNGGRRLHLGRRMVRCCRKVLQMVPEGGLSLEDVSICASIGATDRLGGLLRLRRCKLVDLG